MANIFCVWELGANLGHLGNFKYIALKGLAAGHSVWLVARDLTNVHEVFEGIPVRILQAPIAQDIGPPSIDEMLCFSQLISHYCYRDANDLGTYLSAWDSIFETLQPDIVFYDYSPLALAASWRFSFEKVLIGNGFTLPPTQTPLFGVFPSASASREQLKQIQQAEKRLLVALSELVLPHHRRSINQVADIYRQADHIVRLTIPEFDHFGERPVGPYVGIWPSFGQSKPIWKHYSSRKAFAYLQPFPQLRQLIHDLERAGVETVIYCPKLSVADRQSLTGPLVSFFDSPLDLKAVAGDIDFAITHGNHDTSVQLSLLGVPLITIPRHQEQLFFSIKHKALGLGLIAYQDQPSFKVAIDAILSNGQFRECARALANKYTHHISLNPARVIDQILGKLPIAG